MNATRRRWRIVAVVLLGPLLILALGLLLSRLFLFPQIRYHLATTSLTLQSEDGVALSAILIERQAQALVIVVPAFAEDKHSPEVVRLAEELAGEFDVLVLDLRGHGESEGVYPFDFESVVPDVRAAVTWAEERGYRRIGLVGFSLGGAAGILEQARYDNLDSLVTVGCPATEQMKGRLDWVWSGPGRCLFRLMGTRVAPPVKEGPWPAEVARRVAPVPLLVVHGARDTIVPEEVSQSLYESAREPKGYLALPDAGHAHLGEARSEIKGWLRDTLLLADVAPPAWAHFVERSLADPPTDTRPAEMGALIGTVYAAGGEPLPRAVVLAASEAGHTFHTYSDAEGRFRLELPAGRYVPTAAAPGYDMALFRRGSESRTLLEVAPGGAQFGVQFSLRPHIPWRPDTAAISLTLSLSQEVSTLQPYPLRARRRPFVFAYAGRRVNTCLLYEPLTITAPLPVILAVYPSEAQRWDLVSVPMAAEGYVVLACGPLYLEKLEELDLPSYARDLVAAWALLEAGQLSPQADPTRYGIMTGSISSFILALALPDMPPPRVIVGIGGGYDLFLVLRDLYERPDYALDERLVLGLTALGRPDLYPESFLTVSLRYRAADLPPLGIFHSMLDEVLLVDQAEGMAAELESLGRPMHVFYYEGLAHYPGVEDPPPETLRMYGEIMGLLESYLK